MKRRLPPTRYSQPSESLRPVLPWWPRCLCVLALAVVSAGQAQTINDVAGLAIPLDNSLATARSAALGSALVAAADDGSALFWNPAGLAILKSGEISIHHQLWVADTSQDTLLVALPLGPLGGMGLAASYLDFGSFEGRDSTGAPLPPFSADRIGLAGGWGMEVVKWIAAGLDFRASQMKLAGNSYAYTLADGGLLLRPSPELSLGFAFKDLGQDGSPLGPPLSFYWGAALRPDLGRDWGVLVACAGSMEQGDVNRIQAGMEGIYRRQFALRAGWQFDLTDNQLEGLTGLTVGAGYQWQDLSLDYAFLPMGTLGDSHRISLSYRFQVASPSVSKGAGELESSKAPSPPLNPSPPASAAAPPVGAASTAGSPDLPNLSPVLPFAEKAAAASPPEAVASLSVSEVSGPSTGATDEDDGLDIEFKLPPDTLKQGKELEKQGKYIEAIHLYTQAIHDDQQNLLAWWGLGNIYYRLGRRDYAVQCFEEVLRIKPGAKGLAKWLENYRTSPIPVPASQP